MMGTGLSTFAYQLQRLHARLLGGIQLFNNVRQEQHRIRRQVKLGNNTLISSRLALMTNMGIEVAAKQRG